jgi:hydrogenase maturation protein HypF
MELEFIADPTENAAYDFDIALASPSVVDWEGVIHGVVSDTLDGVRPSRISARFHNSLVEMAVRVAQIADRENVALSGGCFQNKLLTERLIKRLREEDFNVYWHQRVPTNDGGIALGQAVAAAIAVSEPGEKRRTQEICV